MVEEFVKDGRLGVGVAEYVGLQGFVLSRCDGGSEGSGNSVCRNSFGCESEITSRGEVVSIGDDVCLVEVEIVEICVRVGSCKEDACDKKSNGCD